MYATSPCLRALALGAALLLIGAAAEMQAATLMLNPTADAEAASDKPKTNFGYNGTLRVDTKRIAYLRFDLAELHGTTIHAARLRLYPVNSAPARQTVQQMLATTWSESTLTWKNRPTKVEATLATFGPVLTGSWVSVDVTAAIAAFAGRSLTLSILGTNSSTLYVSSREASENKPVLVVDFTRPTPPTPSAGFDVGINLAAPAYWGTELPFLDLMKLSGGWYTQCNPYNSPPDPLCEPKLFPRPGASAWDTLEQDRLVLDEDGWPSALSPNTATAEPVAFTRVAALVPAGLSASRRSGRVIVTYDGEGEIRYALNGSKDDAASTPGRDVLNLNASAAGEETSSMIQVIMTATNPSNHLRNLRVIPDGGVCSNDAAQECTPGNQGTACGAGICQSFETVVQTQPFHPRFLANIKRFGLIRTMEFQNTNDSKLSDWTRRTRPSSVRWTARDDFDGVPLEIIAQLANTLGQDVWLNVPHRAGDDYVTEMARLVRNQLDSRRRVIVEYSNETWNTAFSAGAWVESQGVATWPSSPEHPYVKRLNWYAKRSVEVCQAWKAAWSDDSGRISCVAGAQSASPYYAEMVLDCPLYATTRGRPCYTDFDGLAVAPYFGHYLGSPEVPGGQTMSNADIVAGWTLDTLFHELFTGTGRLHNAPAAGALKAALDELQAQIATARDRNLAIWGYEGGQHLVGVWSAVDNSALTSLFTSANRDARMGLLYQDYLTAWRESGAGPLVLFNSVGSYSKWGSWGLLECRDQDPSAVSSPAPKYKAVGDFLDTIAR